MTRPMGHRLRMVRVAGSAARAIAAGLLLSGSATVGATSADALARYSEASAAFQAQDFSKASALFQQALAAGLDGPAVHYNIGAAAYLGGDLPRAEHEFREVAQTPTMTALAHYNLGLVALQRGDEREARQWFERTVQQDTPDERLQVLASRRLAELPESRAWGAWSYYSRGGIGYDDNVALRSGSIDSSATGGKDAYGEAVFAGSYSFGNWRIDTSGSALEYQKLKDFSQTSLSLGLARGLRLDNWYFELGAYGSRYTLGGKVFERDVSGAAQVTRLFSGDRRLRAQVRSAKVDGQGAFTGLNGSRTEYGLFFDQSLRSWNFVAFSRAEVNDTEDAIFTDRWLELGAEARYALSPLWEFMASAAARRIRHATQSTDLPAWSDRRTTLQLGATRALWKQAQLLVRYELENNGSPVAGYDYDRSRVSASLEVWR